MPTLSHRTAGFTDSVIRRMTRISNRYGAINLSQGFPDFEPPKEILDRLREVCSEDFHQYSITWGAQNFREALAAKQSRLMGFPIDPDREIVVTCGSTEAMMAAMMTVVDPGDKVIVFSPFYENYAADADDVAYVVLFEILIGAFAHVVAAEIALQLGVAVHDMAETRLAHDTL